MTEQELKPCPFCGEAAKITDRFIGMTLVYVAGCTNYKTCFQPSTPPNHVAQNAIDAWNTRNNG